jgi:hypothetical protein
VVPRSSRRFQQKVDVRIAETAWASQHQTKLASDRNGEIQMQN